MIAEVAVSEPVHGTVAERVELVTGSSLGDARAAAAKLAECRHGKIRSGLRQRGGIICEIGQQFPDTQAAQCLVGQEIPRRAVWRQRSTVEIRGQIASVIVDRKSTRLNSS